MAALLVMHGVARAQEGWTLGLREGTCSLGPWCIPVPAARTVGQAYSDKSSRLCMEHRGDTPEWPPIAEAW